MRYSGGASASAKDIPKAGKGTAVLSMDELIRIKESCALTKQKDHEVRAAAKKELYEKSQNRLKNWPNTIQALRKKKDEDRMKKLEEDEIERRKIDAHEEQLQVESR